MTWKLRLLLTIISPQNTFAATMTNGLSILMQLPQKAQLQQKFSGSEPDNIAFASPPQ